MPSTDPNHWFLDAGSVRQNPAFTSDNEVIPLIDGEDYFESLIRSFEEIENNGVINVAAWRLNPETLLNPLPEAEDPSGSIEISISEMLLRKMDAGCSIRALIWNVPGTVTDFSPGHGEENLAMFGLINGHPRGAAVLDDRLPHGTFPSHHQKYIIFNDRNFSRAFIGGIDIAPDRWDAREHDEPDGRHDQREYYDGWHDVQAEVEGPAVSQIWGSFRERWSDPRPPNHFVPHPALPDISNETPTVRAQPLANKHVQVLHTYPCRSHAFPFDGDIDPNTDFSFPFAPQGETTYAGALVKAIDRAQYFVYVEDQYFWPCEIVDALANAAARDVSIILTLTQRFDLPGMDPYHRFMRDACIEQIRAQGQNPANPYVFHLQQIPSFGQAQGDEIYVHSKTVIVDDVYATIGSCNVSNRSTTNDTEIGIAVIDGDVHNTTLRGNAETVCDFARKYRRLLWKDHLGADIEDPLNVDGSPNGWPTAVNAPVRHAHVHIVAEPQWCGPSFFRNMIMNPQLRC